MLRIIQLANAASAKAYYQASDYYLGEAMELPGVWGGKGAELLGLRGQVDDRAPFNNLCDNRLPFDYSERLTPLDKEDRRVGWDFNWHAPKGVTLAYELFKDDRVLDAFRDAVAYAMGRVEADMKTRVRVGGANEDRVVGNAVYATFVHRTARPVGGVPDPHLHAHVVVWNAVHDPVEDRFKAAEMADLRKYSGYYSALFHSKLARSMAELGYGVEHKGDKYWDVAGLSQGLLAKFSKRTELIERITQEAGITNKDSKDALGAKTRERKSDHHSPEQLRKLWIGRLTDQEKHQLKSLGTVQPPLPSPEASARFAIAHEFANEAIRPLKKVLETGLRHGYGAIDLDTLRKELDRQGLIVKGDRAASRELLECDDYLLRFAVEGKGAVKPLSSGKAHSENLRSGLVRPGELNPGQLRAISHALRSTSRVTLIQGKAGTGKTTSLKAVAEEARKSRPVQALANNWEAVKQLREVDGNANTLASFLMSEKAQDKVKGGLWIVDEASQVDTRTMAKLFKAAERTDSRLLLVGDTFQHGSVAAGAPFKLLQDYAGLKAAVIDEIVRQKDERYKLACQAFSEHDILGGLDQLQAMGTVREMTEPYRTEALVIDYLEAVNDGKECLIVAPTHKEADHVTEAVREALKAEGKLKGEEREFDRLVNLNWTEAERLEAKRPESPQVQRVKEEGLTVTRWGVYREATLKLAVGDKLRPTANLTALGVSGSPTAR